MTCNITWPGSIENRSQYFRCWDHTVGIALHRIAATALIAAFALTSAPARAADPEFTIVIQNHKFEPEVVRIPANTRVTLIVDNRDAAPEEFDSPKLRREKVIAGKSKGNVFLNPLPKGEYEFVGEYNPDTAKGKIVAE